MTMDANDLARIAAALERLAPPPPAPADPAAHPAYLWRGAALERPATSRPLPLDRLTASTRRKRRFSTTPRRLAAGAAAHDVLLWGAKGTGKSALVKARLRRCRRKAASSH
jgi:predicted AAA+ superfamily ATPase